MRRKREAGVLMPISALPSAYGIGCFSEEAYRFVDLLAEAGQRVWQILPLCPTGFGDSPYQSPCSFGGNPYFISLDALLSEGLLREDELPKGEWGDRIDYGELYKTRYPILRVAYGRFCEREKPWDYGAFLTESCFWLEDYALFMSIKDKYGVALSDFPEELRKREPTSLSKARAELDVEIGFYKFLQYEFFKQWGGLHSYAASKNIKILGDMPIYVSADSSDLWAAPSLFELDGEGRPIYVAGCPPDGFSPKGQLWGNPVYAWQEHKKEGFRWWRARIRHALSMYDMVRIDHFRGFDAYYSVPYGAEDARHGFWRDAPGAELFSCLGAGAYGDRIIAEDLGFMTEGVRRLLHECGFSGMKILQFGFEGDTEHMPYSYPEKSVAYTGTHDNPTLCGWLSRLGEKERGEMEKYLCDVSRDTETVAAHLIALAMQSPSSLCIIPMQDYLFLGDEGRMNIPSSSEGNWSWRMRGQDVRSEISGRIREFTHIGGRLHNFS